MFKFLLSLTGMALLVWLSMLTAVLQHWFNEIPSFALITLVFLFFSTALIYGYLYRLRTSTIFIQFYLLLMVVKLIGYLAYNVVIVLKDRQQAVENVVFFLCVYFIFTVLEISFLYRLVNRAKRP